MPTEYSLCHECHYIDALPFTHHINSRYKLDHEKSLAIGFATHFPRNVCIKIVRLSHDYTLCDYCNRTLLCEYHHARATGNGAFNMAKCDACHWFDL